MGHGTSLGPRCKVRGEVEQTVFQGFCNKAHDGFVGHSFVGEWGNLGASTVTSDLKNTYGPVRLEVDGVVGPQLAGRHLAFQAQHVPAGLACRGVPLRAADRRSAGGLG